jgi:hypothetical protein
LRAFWSFVHRQYGLASAARILETLDETAPQRLHKELADPANYGMARSFFMMGSKAGFDMTTQTGLNEFMAAYNSTLPARQPAPSVLPDVDGPRLLPERPTGDLLKRKRKERKQQRQARKRGRRG